MIGGIILTWLRTLKKVFKFTPFVAALVLMTTTDSRIYRFISIFIILAWWLILVCWREICEIKKEEIWHFDGDSKSSSTYKFR